MTRQHIDRRTHKGRVLMVITRGKRKARKPVETVLEQRSGYVVPVRRPPQPIGLAAQIAAMCRYSRFPKELWTP